MSDYLWVEKYRPKTIKDCILTEELKNTFTQFFEGIPFFGIIAKII